LNNLKKNISAGYEGIWGKILKYSVHAVTKPLNQTSNASLNQAIYPARLKFELVQLIYTKGENLM